MASCYLAIVQLYSHRIAGCLKDISEHPTFDTGEVPGKGTFGLGNDNNKIDYLLLSPPLFSKVTACGLFTKGAWPVKVLKDGQSMMNWKRDSWGQ